MVGFGITINERYFILSISGKMMQSNEPVEVLHMVSEMQVKIQSAGSVLK